MRDNILLVCPNLGIDHTVRLARLEPGTVTRTGPGWTVAGGKGANVARALSTGADRQATTLGFAGTAGGPYLESLFAAESLPLSTIGVDGAVRTTTALIEDSGRVTLLNEPGPAVGPAQWASLLAAATRLLTSTVRIGWSVAGSGSLPPGSPADSYARLVEAAHRAEAFCAIDSTGEPLRLAAAAGADLVCPNLSEAETLIGGTAAEQVDEQAPDVPDRALRAAESLVRLGAGAATVTAGASGVGVAWRAADRPRSQWLVTPRVDAVNPIGAGDSFLAGLLAAVGTASVGTVGGGSENAGDTTDWPAATQQAMAFAASSVENERAGIVDPVRVAQLLAG
ncbi:1-phosphofructokinase family hexose kinase [Nakamurella aerolata]|uniref:1-phosphofructokinase n=1 Tax=Nakamurella aerolata TaxID=1656892 RepID=A0A849AEW3_9ACTN|nr:PfkB family carbohydrate kinase [Nakamurella aerolata]NNG37010.1 1-phosphofructokinase [Nakamurella aerolata]